MAQEEFLNSEDLTEEHDMLSLGNLEAKLIDLREEKRELLAVSGLTDKSLERLQYVEGLIKETEESIEDFKKKSPN